MIRQRLSSARVDVVFAVGRLSERRGEAVNDLLAGCLQRGIFQCIYADDVILLAGDFLHLHRQSAGERGANLIHGRPVGEGDGNQSSASEVDSVAGSPFDSQTHETSRREKQGEDDERPLLAEKIKVGML